MHKDKLVTIIGARPQFIKAAAVSRILRSQPQISEVLVHTGQHYDDNMSKIFFDELEIPEVAHHLEIGSGMHGAQTGRMMEAIERVLLAEKPNWVLVYGDTNSTLAGALTATKLHFPVAHVEAGLRSFNRKMPEEVNRVLTDHISEVLFAPARVAVENLQREGIDNKRIRLVGDVMYDAALFYGKKAEKQSKVLEQLRLQSKSYILATIHRAENTDDSERLNAIFDALTRVAQEIPVILPLHPRTRKALEREGLNLQLLNRIHIIDPIGYLDMVMLEKHARLVVTDSGGVQKEAYFYRTPCITLRDETEWIELVEAGWNKLVPPIDSQSIVENIFDSNRIPSSSDDLYGTGAASQAIVSSLMDRL